MIEIKWWHVTRGLGLLAFLYGLLVDDSPERSTIMLLGAGMAGFDKVSRTEPVKGAKDDTSPG